MKIGVVVSEFPKLTETFVLRNIREYVDLGHPTVIFHLKPFLSDQPVHGFARPLLDCAYYLPFLFSFQVFWSCMLVLVTRPLRLAALLYLVIKTGWGEWAQLIRVLAIFPKALAYGRYARVQGVQHIHAEFAGLPASSAWIISQIYSIPFSFSCHAHDIFISQLLLQEKVQAASFVRVISDFNREFLLRKLTLSDPEKLQVIRCGVEPTELICPQRIINAKAKFLILYVGSLLERKGVDHLLLALSRLKDLDFEWQCNIIGDGSRKDRLHQLVSEMGLENQVCFDGSKTYEQIKCAYELADLVVAPSIVGPKGRCEGIPVVIMEALACGCPTISTAVSGIPELLEEGVTGYLVEPGDVGGLSKKIEWVYRNFDQACQTAEEGRRRVLSDYDVTKNARQLLDSILQHKAQEEH